MDYNDGSTPHVDSKNIIEELIINHSGKVRLRAAVAQRKTTA